MSMEMNKAPVEQAVGDERAAFEQWLEQHMSHHFSPELDLAKYEDSGEYRYNPAADYWKAWQARAALAQPSPAQAEAERPEVAGYRSKESGMVYEQDYGLKNPEALTTVAECERIVGALRADRDSWAEQAEQRLADWDEMRKERDAALARVAELERQEPVALANRGLHAFWVKWTEAAAGLYGPGIKLYAAPVAQAQHSVPEGWMLVPVEPLLNMMSDKDHDTRIMAERQLLSILAAAPAQGGE